MEKHDIMTIQEVAKYVRVSERTIYDWAAKGQIPCGKLGTTWRFKRDEIEKWVDQKLTPQQKGTADRSIKIGDILHHRHVLVLETSRKTEALDALIEALGDHPAVRDKDEVREGTYHRESLMSTGIGLGIAVPHVRLESIETMIMAVGISRREISDYESLDGQGVQIVFMIVGSKGEHTQHIRTLAAISKKLKDAPLRHALLAAESDKEIYDILTHDERIE